MNQGMEQSDEEEGVQLNTDIEGERALCGSFDEGEKLDYDELIQEEESDIKEREVQTDPESDSEEESDDEVAQCI